uniref:Copper transporter n=1 Tax=Steinernema glaseri TaxID=37863 RepID=A0A1I8A100_9BILA
MMRIWNTFVSIIAFRAMTKDIMCAVCFQAWSYVINNVMLGIGIVGLISHCVSMVPNDSTATDAVSTREEEDPRRAKNTDKQIETRSNVGLR